MRRVFPYTLQTCAASILPREWLLTIYFSRSCSMFPESALKPGEKIAQARALRSHQAMCGIVGYVGPRAVVPLLVGGLQRLEYRGYDSAGVAIAGNGHGLVLRRAQGKLAQLEQLLASAPPEGTYGIGHTRWATHGRPSERNAHPHSDCTGRIAVAHNGIIENYSALKERLRAAGHVFSSDTDTEVIAHLIESHLNGNLAAAVRKAVAELQGSFALAVVSSAHPEEIVAARLGAPVIVGMGENENFVASDVLPVLPYTRRVIYLADGEIAVVRRSGVEISDFAGTPRVPAPQQIRWDAQLAEKGGFRHFMQKEIYEQPCAIRDTVRGRLAPEGGRVCLSELGVLADELAHIERVHLIACGTSLHAGMVGKWMMESLAGIPVEIDYASEYRYRNPLADTRTLGVLISQSGETADTLAAGREVREKGARTLAISNVPASTLTRESDGTILTQAGPEVGVAATKTFSAQLTALLLLAIEMAQHKGRLDPAAGRSLLEELMRIPARIEQLLGKDEIVESIARRFYRARDVQVIGLLNEGDLEGRSRCDAVIEIPPTQDLLLPLLAVVPLQLLAYHIAVLRGCDVDQPRNLAKSVTVE